MDAEARLRRVEQAARRALHQRALAKGAQLEGHHARIVGPDAARRDQLPLVTVPKLATLPWPRTSVRFTIDLSLVSPLPHV
mgnify:CR=1 FL=1